MPETPATWRTVAALQELQQDGDPPFQPDAVDLDETDGETVTLTDLPIEQAGARLETLDAMSDEEYEALTAALENGTVDPSEELHDVNDAREAAQRALGARSEG